MSLYPDAAGLVLEPYAWTPRFRTFVAGPFGNENIVTRAAIQFPLHSCRLRYYLAAWDPNIRAVYEFFADRRGRLESFTFYDLQGWDAATPGIQWGTYTDSTHQKGPVFVKVQPASGGTATFDIPARHASQSAVDNDSSKHMMVDGTNVSVTSWTWNTGTDGRTRVVLAATPGAGSVVTCTFTARRVWNAKFDVDQLEMEWSNGDFYSLSVPLVEVP